MLDYIRKCTCGWALLLSALLLIVGYLRPSEIAEKQAQPNMKDVDFADTLVF